MTLKTKMRIRTSVKDYFEMFPEDWELCKLDIQYQRQNLKTEFAELEGNHALKRALFSIPEKLYSMICLKLTTEERQSFSEKENQRWFAKEFSQFRITSNI